MSEINQTRKHRFNAVDAVILALVIIVIGAVVYLVGVKGSAGRGADGVTLEYIVEFRMINDEFVDNFVVGDKVIDSVAKYQVGEIVAVNAVGATFNGTDLQNGKLVISNYPGHSNVQITIRVPAAVKTDDMRGNYYMIDDGYCLTVGAAVYLRTPHYVGQGYCIGMKETEAK